jgi:Spy/CpxP family protein refolding chaperone
MDRKAMKLNGIALAFILAVTRAVQAQQHQQRYQGGTQTSQGQMPEASQEAPAPMMQQMQGMMMDMHEMMQQMQGMMGRRGGMMAEEGETDEDTPGDMMGMMGMMERGGMMGHGHMILRKLDYLAEQLNLTEAQQTQIRSLARDHMKTTIRARADIAVQRVDLIALLDAESMDLPKVKETLESLASKRADFVFAHVMLMDEIDKLLTPEQQQQFQTIRRQMMHDGGMMGMMGRGGMHGQGRMMKQGGMQGQGGRRNPGGMICCGAEGQ